MIEKIGDKNISESPFLKQDKLPMRSGAPKKNEGLDGDIVLRRVENKLKIFGKFNNEWYSFAETIAQKGAEDIPEITSALAKRTHPSFSSSWLDLSTGVDLFSGVHAFNSVPIKYEVVFSNDGGINVSSLATDLGNNNGFVVNFNKGNWTLARDTGGWGYAMIGTTITDINTVGKIKLKLWK